MRSLYDLPLAPEPQLALTEPFDGPTHEHSAGAELHALGGPAAVLKAAAAEDDVWDPTAVEDTGCFDIHLGVYVSD